MDILTEIQNLLDSKNGTEESIVRRNQHIKWIWATLAFILTTGAAWIIAGTLWYSKMEHMARAVDQIYLKVFGYPMP